MDVVELGNADLANRLREAFDIAKRFNIDLATTIVPVVAIDLNEAADVGATGGFLMGTTRPSQTGSVSLTGLFNGSAEDVLIEELTLITGAGALGALFITDVALAYTDGNELLGVETLDSHANFAGISGINAWAAPAALPVGWDSVYSNRLIPTGSGSRLRFPIVLHPGERLYCWPLSTAAECSVSLLGR